MADFTNARAGYARKLAKHLKLSPPSVMVKTAATFPVAPSEEFFVFRFTKTRALIVLAIALIPAIVAAKPMIQSARVAPSTRNQFLPSRQGPYVVHQLDALANADWARVGGTDVHKPPHVNGSNEFASRWLGEMKRDLHGLPFGVFTQYTPVPGFAGEPAKTLGKNIIVVVPGTAHAEQAVVVGSHYDGDPRSHGSAFDDTSGSTVILGVARSLGAYWRAHGLPQRSVEFVIYDAEEQGVIGSAGYLWYYRHGAVMPKPTMMIDEEQTGVGYPVHPFGLSSEPALPVYAITTAQGPVVKKLFHPLKPLKMARLKVMRKRLVADRATTFHQLQQIYGKLDLRDSTLPAFTPADVSKMVIGATPVCCSDNGPFEALGLPTVTFSGDFQFYAAHHRDWAYPFDQPSDTPAALACDTGGSPKPSVALEADLSIDVVMSYELVNQYDPVGGTLKTFSVMTSRIVAGHKAEFMAAGPGPIAWNFGDGSKAKGSTVHHIYARAGKYMVTVRSSRATGSGDVVVKPTVKLPHPWSNVPKAPRVRPFAPRELRSIPGCP